MRSTPIRILHADDHEIFRQGFHVFLSKESEIQILEQAYDGLDLIKKVEEFKPDVILTDIKMPNLDGIEATRKIVLKYPNINIIALTMFQEEQRIIDFLEAGGKGYLLKNVSKSEILQAIKAVYHGGTYFDNTTTKSLALLIGKKILNKNYTNSHKDLSPKEIDIIRCICQGMTAKEISEKFSCSTRTIENYRERIQEKIGVNNMAGMVVYAIKNNIYLVE